MKKLLILLIISIVFSAFSFVVMARNFNPTSEDPLVLRLGYTNPVTWPDGSEEGPQPEHAIALVFKNTIESRTNGAVKVQLFANGQLGNSQQMQEMVQSGTIDLCISTGTTGTYYPPFEMIYIPYLFESEEVAWWLFDNSAYWQKIEKEMEEKTGMVTLAIGQNGVRNFTNNVHPIKKPSDLNGLKIRVMQSPVYTKMIKAFGAEAVPMAYGELYTSLQTGVVDGEENPLSAIIGGNLQEVQKYLTLDAHSWSEDILHMNADLFYKLPENLQHQFKIAGHQAEIASRAADLFSARVYNYKIAKENMEIYTPTSKEREEFRKVAQPPVLEYMRNKFGEEKVNNFLKAVENAEQALGY